MCVGLGEWVGCSGKHLSNERTGPGEVLCMCANGILLHTTVPSTYSGFNSTRRIKATAGKLWKEETGKEEGRP